MTDRGLPLRGPIVVRSLRFTDYVATWHAMKAFTDTRGADTPDEIWLTEHPPVYTLGLAGRAEHVLRSHGIPLIRADRGGQVTYHGPGQIVAYLMLDLRRARLGVRDMVCRIETAVIGWLATFGIRAHGKRSAPGVYVDRDGGEAKIAALGLRVRKGCTYHGVAINVDMDLRPFRDIDPCGHPGLAVAQLADFGVKLSLDEAGRGLAPLLAAQFSTSQPKSAARDAALAPCA